MIVSRETFMRLLQALSSLDKLKKNKCEKDGIFETYLLIFKRFSIQILTINLGDAVSIIGISAPSDLRHEVYKIAFKVLNAEVTVAPFSAS